MKFANLSYLKEIPSLDQYQDVHVLDLLCNPLTELCIDNFPNLQRLRASRSKLEKVKITNCPNLQVIDISQNRLLTDLNLENLPNLACLDLRNTQVSFLNFSLPSLQYLDISKTKINNELPDSPNLLSFDNSGCRLNDIDFLQIVTKYPRLQRLRYLDYFGYNQKVLLDLNKISEHQSLEHILCCNPLVICDSISPNSNISTICLFHPEFKYGSKDQILSEFNALIIEPNSSDCDVSEFSEFYKMLWEDSAIMVYGPWGIPKTDYEAKISPQQPFDVNQSLILMNDVQTSNETFSDVSEKYDVDIALDRMMGAVFGSALGDCLGLSTEFTDTNYARFALDSPISILWNSLHSWQNSDTFQRGTVTDDTEQAIMLMRTLGDCNGEMNLAHFANLMMQWMRHGISEHGQKHALDVGGTTRDAITSKDFTKDPLRGSMKRTSRTVGNGCAMRTAPIGCFKFWDLNTVAKYALNFGCVTHFSGVCGVGTVLTSLLIAEQIKRASSKIKQPPLNNEEIDKLIDKSIEIVENALKPNFNLQENQKELQMFLKAQNFKQLDLCGRKTGHVLKAVGAAVLSLRKGLSFEKAMKEVIRWAGDADTNAAVVGGVIGAAVGFSNISQDMMKYLFTGNWLFVEFARMCKAMGIQPPESPFLNLSFQ